MIVLTNLLETFKEFRRCMVIAALGLHGFDNYGSYIPIFLLTTFYYRPNFFETFLILLLVVTFVLLEWVFVTREIGDWPIERWNVDFVNRFRSKGMSKSVIIENLVHVSMVNDRPWKAP